MLGFKTHTYNKMYELKMKKESVRKIVNLMLEDRPAEKRFSIEELPTTFKIIYCDCSDGDIFDDNVADAFYSEIYPQVVFVDPYNKSELWSNIAHEIIHDLQQILYLFMDEDDVPYKERWQERMAYNLENKVERIIKSEKLNYKVVKKGHIEIDNILLNLFEMTGFKLPYFMQDYHKSRDKDFF